MRHNQFNKEFVFYKEPEEFNKYTNKSFLQYCLGATLYMPGTREVLDKILTKNMNHVTSMVMCFEDAVKEEDVPAAEQNVLKTLSAIYSAVQKKKIGYNDIPLIFIRVRNTEQFDSFSKKLTLEHINTLSGFVFPKFYSNNANQYLGQIQKLNKTFDASLYGMPILEGRTIAYLETRQDELVALKKILEPFKHLILNIRVGGTDFSSVFGVRRGINTSIYEILTVRDCLSDILNIFNRDNSEYTISGPVWEYFLAHKKDNITELLEKNIHHSILSRNKIINDAIDGLLREVVLDIANGFVGKTIIHPSHVKFVNGMQAVTSEEYEDAAQILETCGGVVKSKMSNKMNEISPHRNWAIRITNRAKAYGVIDDEKSYIKLIMG